MGPFPYPAVSHEPRIQQLSDDLERMGHTPFHLPVGLDLDEQDPDGGRRCAATASTGSPASPTARPTPDYYNGADDFDFPLGHLQVLGKSDRSILRAGAPWFAPGLAPAYMAPPSACYRPDRRSLTAFSG